MRSAQQEHWPFIGTWHLVSCESRDESGGVQYPLGRDVVGQLMYDAEGNMSAFLAQGSVPPFASDDLSAGTDVEIRAAFNGFFGYFGHYTVNLAQGIVTHHIRGASFPNWAGVEQVRHFRADGRRLILWTPPISIESRKVTIIAIWERAGAA